MSVDVVALKGFERTLTAEVPVVGLDTASAASSDGDCAGGEDDIAPMLKLSRLSTADRIPSPAA